MEITPKAMAMPKDTSALPQGEYGPIFPKSPACHGFTIIAKIIPGRESVFYQYGQNIEQVLAAQPTCPRSKQYLLHVVATLLFAAAVLGQEIKPAKPSLTTVVARLSPASAASNSETSIKKKLSKPLMDYSIAKKAKFEWKELDKDSADSSDAAQNTPAAPQDTQALAKKLANPVASLISFPIQMNFDFGMGTGGGWRMTTNIQPVVPIALNKDWNLISRTILPIIRQGNVVAQGTGQTGLGDVVQSIFLSPNKTEPVIWGIGPAALIPTATNSSLGSRQWGLGPTAVVLKQRGPWTVGALWNHIWRVSGGNGRSKVNARFHATIPCLFNEGRLDLYLEH
jgi:hypothetical protein